jgi:tRNA-dihydrouridine synthase B
MTSLTLGPLHLKNQFLLAPMEAVSDVGFRSLCHSLGASLTYTEMVRGASFLRENKATLDLVDTFDPQTPTGIQFLVKGPQESELVLKRFFELRKQPAYAHFKNITAIDLNFGCPSPENIRIGAGPALVKRTQRMSEIFKTMHDVVKAHDETIAISAKIRLGLNASEKQQRVAFRLLEPANAHLDFLTVHPKHAGETGRDPADWQTLAAMREQCTIPVIGNGGALDAEAARRMLRETKVAGVMLARGAIQNPWIFRALSDTGPEVASKEEMRQAFSNYTAIAQRFKTKQKYLEFHEQNFARLLDPSAKPRYDANRAWRY